MANYSVSSGSGLSSSSVAPSADKYRGFSGVLPSFLVSVDRGTIRGGSRP